MPSDWMTIVARCELPEGSGVLPAFLVEGGCLSAEFYTNFHIGGQSRTQCFSRTDSMMFSSMLYSEYIPQCAEGR